jgi:hypothetical protein
VGQFTLVDDDAGADEVAAPVSKGEQSGDAWDSAARSCGGFAIGERLAAVAGGLHVKGSVDGELGIHTSTSMFPKVKLCMQVS